MTNLEIIALRCPSCSGAVTQPLVKTSFGAEFHCEICGITSVLIINQALVPLSSLQKQGEKVCTTCGRIAQREARFCQEGHSLVKRCNKCGKEFSIYHQRCDFCGWLQSVTPGTPEAEIIDFEEAISELNEMSHAEDAWQRIEYTLAKIELKVHKVSLPTRKAAVAAIFNVLQHLMKHGHETSVSLYIWKTLIVLGSNALDPADRQFIIPILRQSIDQKIQGFGLRSFGRHWDDLMFLGDISPKDALEYCAQALEDNSTSAVDGAVQVAFSLGNIAIPSLERYCGMFSGDRGWKCKVAIKALRNGEKTLNLSRY